jgi:serine/threonine-protein kinase
LISSDSLPVGGFTPGMVLANRYRIIGLIGRGGMGEVYRADDLKLGQPVALKFLPRKLAEDPVRRERFFAEVRITRQLSHPNICRVYDIGEADGRHFLSMEYIDGEDLASLIKRIGYLSNEKALDIARQLAAGLAAAHERGVLHRDLKPANIMLDGRGHVRITDFGLAIAAEDETQAVEIAGTPAYMAPEQLAGKGATVRSDIYSLGLILYELYTGKKAFTATNLAELREQKESHIPRAISEIREGMDPVVERLIRRCMEKDPNARPASVAQLALALPGGDPLAAALAAGETPSPEMVAASGGKEGLRPALAWMFLAIIVVGILALLPMRDRRLRLSIPFEKDPVALVERCQSFLQKAGLSGQFKDSAYGFIANNDLLKHFQDLDTTGKRWKKLDARVNLFWYRQSPEALRASRPTVGSTPPDDPPLQYVGEVFIMIDAEERLVSLRCVPPKQSKVEAVPPPDWKLFFSEAGLNISQWTPTDLQRTPHDFADSRFAWQGLLPGRPQELAHIEAASFQGKPVSFEIIDPWAPNAQLGSALKLKRLGGMIILIVIVTAAACGIFFARRNLRLGRGDRRNATRLALFALGALALQWVLKLPQVSPADLLIVAAYGALLFWVLYVAIEPYVRRKWPQVLISWTRLLSGEWRDPLVARDMLVGVAFGIILACAGTYMQSLPSRLLFGIDRYEAYDLASLLGTRFLISALLLNLLFNVLICLAPLCFLVVSGALLKSQKAAIAVQFLLITVLMGYEGGFVLGLAVSTLWLFALIRFGLTAAILTSFTSAVLTCELAPITLRRTWYAPYGYLVLAIFAVIVLYAFRYSLGGRPLLAPSRLDE